MATTRPRPKASCKGPKARDALTIDQNHPIGERQGKMDRCPIEYSLPN